jgi:hypothetical protein
MSVVTNIVLKTSAGDKGGIAKLNKIFRSDVDHNAASFFGGLQFGGAGAFHIQPAGSGRSAATTSTTA